MESNVIARRSAEWDPERKDIDRPLAALGNAKTNYLASGISARAAPSPQRRTARCGTVEYFLRNPFDLLADIPESRNWRGGVDDYRTSCLVPTPEEVIAVFEALEQWA